jgi:hypothetical protein
LFDDIIPTMRQEPRAPTIQTADEIDEQIASIREVLAGLVLTINRLEDLAETRRSEETPAPEEEGRDQQQAASQSQLAGLKIGDKVKIISRRNEPWETGKYVGRGATIEGVTAKCVWLSIQGRVGNLRRNKEFVELV